MTRNVPVPPAERTRYVLTDDDILAGSQACLIEDHYSATRGRPTPMDMEWAKDGLTGDLFIVQTRPETVQAHKTTDVLERYHLQQRGSVLVRGQSVGEKIRHGPVRLIKDVHHLQTFHEGEVLVTDKTDPGWEPIMKKAAAIITNRGGHLPCRHCQPRAGRARCGRHGTRYRHPVRWPGRYGVLRRGETGVVYDGALPFTVERVRLRHPRLPPRR